MENGKSFKFYSVILIVYVFIIMYVGISLTGPESMNLLLPALEQKFGWSPGVILPSLAGIRILGIFTGFIMTSIMMKFGIKRVTATSLVLIGALQILMGNVQSLNQFVWVNVVMAFVGPAIMVAQGALIANWFIRTRGKILGIVTIAFPLSTATFVPIGTTVLVNVGYSAFFSGVGAVVIIIGLIGFAAMKDRPEDLGLDPDGKPFTEAEKAKIKEMEERKSDWSIKRLVRTKEMWIYCLGWGFIALVMTSMISQLIPILTQSGIPINQALLLMSVAAVLGMPMSYLWGWMDDKIGTPKTSIVFALVYLIGAVGFIGGSAGITPMFYLAVLCLALATGGMPNLQPSLLAYIFGRKDFLQVNRYAIMVLALFTGFGMGAIGLVHAIFGTYTPIFWIDIVIVIIISILFSRIKKTYDPERIEMQQEGIAK